MENDSATKEETVTKEELVKMLSEYVSLGKFAAKLLNDVVDGTVPEDRYESAKNCFSGFAMHVRDRAGV